MGRIESVHYECDWCGVREPVKPDDFPPDWRILDFSTMDDALCGTCTASALAVLAEAKGRCADSLRHGVAKKP